ncbi:MAG: hypothetical protein F6K65_14640 [Moorea sp. SIO3C2]|nr:hypothetical protein [Moorena sp. SIO3C2]
MNPDSNLSGTGILPVSYHNQITLAFGHATRTTLNLTTLAFGHATRTTFNQITLNLQPHNIKPSTLNYSWSTLRFFTDRLT